MTNKLLFFMFFAQISAAPAAGQPAMLQQRSVGVIVVEKPEGYSGRIKDRAYLTPNPATQGTTIVVRGQEKSAPATGYVSETDSAGVVSTMGAVTGGGYSEITGSAVVNPVGGAEPSTSTANQPPAITRLKIVCNGVTAGAGTGPKQWSEGLTEVWGGKTYINMCQCTAGRTWFGAAAADLTGGGVAAGYPLDPGGYCGCTSSQAWDGSACVAVAAPPPPPAAAPAGGCILNSCGDPQSYYAPPVSNTLPDGSADVTWYVWSCFDSATGVHSNEVSVCSKNFPAPPPPPPPASCSAGSNATSCQISGGGVLNACCTYGPPELVGCNTGFPIYNVAADCGGCGSFTIQQAGAYDTSACPL
jgi:hypothetical protein